MSCKNCKCKIGLEEPFDPTINEPKIETNELFNFDEDNYDPEQWKIEITKVENGYIVRNKSENSVLVFEDEGGEVEGLANMLYYVGSEFGSRFRLEINSLESKHDYLKEDYKEMLKDVYQSYNDDSHDVEKDTLAGLEEIFGKFKWRDNEKTN